MKTITVVHDIILVPKVLLNYQQILGYHPSFYEQNENQTISTSKPCHRLSFLICRLLQDQPNSSQCHISNLDLFCRSNNEAYN